jgi:hypothetical protein
LEARRESGRRHPPLSLDPESLTQGELDKARDLLGTRVPQAVQNAAAAGDGIEAAVASPLSSLSDS